jgi:hypothetical protein
MLMSIRTMSMCGGAFVQGAAALKEVNISVVVECS